MRQDIRLIERTFNWHKDCVDFRFSVNGEEAKDILSYEDQITHYNLRRYPLSATGQLACFDDHRNSVLEAAARKIPKQGVGRV